MAAAASVWLVIRIVQFARSASSSLMAFLILPSSDHVNAVRLPTDITTLASVLANFDQSCTSAVSLSGRSSVDGNLHRKGLAPAGAFAGKVVWITGASQVDD